MKIAILTVYTPDIWCYAKYTSEVNMKYAAKHGYDYLLVKNTLTDRHPAWAKIDAWTNISPSLNYDYIFVLDADCMILRDEIKLESFIKGNESYHMLICDDKPNGGPNVNCGCMIIKECDGSILLMSAIWLLGESLHKEWDKYHEQECLNHLLKNPNIAENVKVFPVNAFNSWHIRPERPVPKDNFIAHVMAYSTEDKTKMLKSFYDEIQ